MYYLTRGLFVVMVFVAGMVTTLWLQANGVLKIFTKSGDITPLYSFSTVAYLAVVLVCLIFAAVFYVVGSRLPADQA